MAQSTANPELAYIWLNGDAYRAPAGTKLDASKLDELEIEGWDAFGGIEAGFEQTAEQSVNKKTVWNYRQAPYKVARDPLQEGFKFRAVDNSKATTMTRLQGGKVVEVNGIKGYQKGEGEEFAFFTRVEDGEDKAYFYCERATLANPATRAAMDGQNIDGWEFDLTFLTPLLEIPVELIELDGADSEESGPDAGGA